MYNRQFSRKHRTRRKRKINFKRLLLSIVFLCIISLMPLAYGSFFAIKEIVVTGNKKIPSEDILQSMKNYYDKNLLSIKTADVKNTLQGTLPLEEVKIEYKLPKTLVVKVKEREIVAAVNYLNGFALIDEHGIVVELKNKLGNYSIPIVTGLDVVEANIAKKPVFDNGDECFQKLLELLTKIDNISSELSEINTVVNKHGDTNFYLYTLDGYQIFIGKGDNKKLSILDDLLQDIRNKDIGKGLLDVTHNTPIFKPF